MFFTRVSCLVIIKRVECIDRILQNIWGHNCQNKSGVYKLNHFTSYLLISKNKAILDTAFIKCEIHKTI